MGRAVDWLSDEEIDEVTELPALSEFPLRVFVTGMVRDNVLVDDGVSLVNVFETLRLPWEAVSLSVGACDCVAVTM